MAATDAPTMEIRNRIVGLVEVTGAEIHDHPKQYRTHGKSQLSALRDSLQEIGQADVIIVYESDGYFPGELVAIDGHGRKNESGVGKWTALKLDLNDAEADFLLATLDPLTAMAGTNHAKFTELYDSLPLKSEAVQMLLDDTLGVRMPNKDLQMRPVEDNSVPNVQPLDGTAVGRGMVMAIPEAAVRMAQLYLNTKTHPQLMAWVDALSGPLKTSNLTETVMAAVEFAHRVIIDEGMFDLLLPQETDERDNALDPMDEASRNIMYPADHLLTPEEAASPEYGGHIPLTDSRAATDPDPMGGMYVCEACEIGWDKDDAEMGGGLCPNCGLELVYKEG